MLRATLLSSLFALASVWRGAAAHVKGRQTDMMELVPVALDMVSKGHTDEPQLRTWESFFWGPDPADSVVNLTVYFGSQNQMVISEDRISSLLSSAVCSSAFDMITYTFKDAASYQEIVKNWNWVNQQVFRSFILTVTDKGCQATPDGDGRQAYQVNGITWNDDQRQALLKVQAKTFMQASGAGDTTGNSGNTWDMVVDSAGLTAAAQKRRKRVVSLDRSSAISIARDFTQNFFKSGPVSVDCSKCGTDGTLSFRFQYSPRVLSPSSGSAEIRTNGVAATFQVTVSANGNADPINKFTQLQQVALPGGFVINGILAFGPTLNVGFNTQLSINVSGAVTFGANMILPDSIARADLFDNKRNSIDGGRFVPKFAVIQPNANAQATVQGSVNPQIILAIEASILGIGASAGLLLGAPILTANVQANLNTQGGVCNNPKAKAGVSFDFGVGAQFDGFGGLQPAAKLPNRGTIVTTSQGLFSTCVGLAKRAEATPTGVASPELLG